jgi:cell division protein FtsB
LAADIKDLKHGSEAIEERARQDLGMVKQNETYYQVID